MQGIAVISTDLSIRMSFVGSIELFLDDAALDDPRLDPEPSPLRGVMLNEKARDIADDFKKTDRFVD